MTVIALTISITANADQVNQVTSQVSANLSAAFAGIQNQLNQTEKASTQATAKMVTGLQQLSQQGTVTAFGQGALGKAFLQTGQAAGATTTQLQRLQQQYLNTEKASDQFGRGLSLLRTSLSSLGVTAGVAGLVQLVRSFVQAGLQMDRFERQLTTATGSLTGAQQAFTFITAESNRLGQSIQTMVPVFTQLTAATRGTTLEGEKTRALFSALAGSGVAVGLSTEATGRAMTGLIQIISQNAIQLDEFRNQFSSQIPGAMRETAKALGEMGVTARGSISEMLELISKGALPVETLMQAVTKGLQEVQAAAPPMADSVEGAFNRFRNDAFQLKADLARSGLLELLGEIAKAGADALFNAGKALGIAAPNVSRDIQQAQKELALLLAARQEYQAVAERARGQGLVPESELMAMAELDKRITGVTTRLQGLQDQFQAGERAAKIATDATSAQNRKSADEEKKFFDERKKRQDALAAAPGLIQAEAKTREALLKQGEAGVQKFYAQQRAMSEQNLKEELATTGLTLEQAKGLREQHLGDIRLLEQQEAGARLDARKTAADQELTDGRRVLAAQIAAAGDAQEKIAVLEAQRPALAADHAAKIADIDADRVALQAKSAEQGTKVLGDELEKRLQAEQKFTDLTEEVKSKHTEWVFRELEKIETAHERLDAQQERETQRALDAQARAYESFSERVVDFTAGVFEELLRGTLNAVDFFKSLLIKQLADIAARVISPFLTAVSSSIIGGIANLLPQVVGQAVVTSAGLAGTALGATGGTGGTGGGSLLETGGTALTGVALAKSLYSYLGLDTLVGYVSNGFSSLSETLFVGIDSLFGTAISSASQSAAVNAALATEAALGIDTAALGASGTAGQVSSSAAATGASQAGSIAGIAGGLAALGGGIYAALNASNAASKAAFAASAAAGAATAAVAAYGAVTGAAVVTAAGTGWTGIGAIVAAVMAVIGVVLDRVIKPSGPTLAVGRPSGLGIGVEGGQLAVAGDLGSRVLRQEKVDPGLAQSVQAQMEEGITSAVMGMVQVINSVALDPAKLLEPTQAALRDALASVKDLNSSNAEKMQSDITEQLRFINIQIVGGLLDPVNKAFDQLRDDASLQQQLERLPGTTSGLVAIFKNLNVQLDEIAKSENADVLRQLSAVRGQVENFGNRIAGTAGQIAESIVNGIIESFQTKIDPTLAGQITQFAELMNDSFGALAGLRTTQQTLESVGLPGGGVEAQINRLAEAMGLAAERMSTEIVTTALQDISGDLQQVLVQPLQVQATTVNALFNDALAALGALGAQWSALSSAGLDTTRIQEQFTRLVGGILDTTTQVLDQALTEGTFSEFLGVLASIPKAVTNLNPAFAQLRAIGEAFVTVVGPVAQRIATLEDAMRTTAERLTFTATRITDLQAAIGDAGDAADRALPLYAQLSQAVVASAALQIQLIQEIAQAWEQAMDQVQADIDSLEASLGSLDTQLARAVTNMIVSADDFNTVVATGDMVGAIEAIHVYEQALIALADLQIQQLQAHRQATIDAQQAVIDGVQGQIEAQQDVIDGVQEQIDAQQDVIDSYNDLIEAQQDVIDGVQEQIDAVQDAVRAQQEHVNSLQEEAKVRQDAVDALTREIESLTQLRDRVSGLTRAGLSPARQAPAIRQELAATQAQLGTVSGDEAIKSLEKLISLNEELMRLGEESSQLLLINEALDNLNILQADLNARLAGKEGELPIAQQQLDAANAAVATATLQLDALNAQIDVLNQQLKTQQEVLAGIQDQQKGQQEVLKGIQGQLEVEQKHLEGLQDQLEVQQKVLAEIEKSTYWDQQIATIQTILLNELYNIKNWLVSVQGDTTWEDQILAIQKDTVAWLQQIERDLGALFIKTVESSGAAGISANATNFWLERMSLYNMALPMKVQVSNFYEAPHQRGGPVMLAAGGIAPQIASMNRAMTGPMPPFNYASGGQVPVKLEPKEGVFIPPFKPGEQTVLLALNAAFPRSGPAMPFDRALMTAHRFGGLVPGSGSGDTVSTQVPAETIILNRHAMAALMGVSQGQEIPERATRHQQDALQAVSEVFPRETFTKRLDGSTAPEVHRAAIGGLLPSILPVTAQMGGIPSPASWPSMRTREHSMPKLMPPSRSSSYQGGGPVPAKLEPGERVYTPPMSMAQQGALVAMNREFPRFGGGGFTVPGRGSGDSVPMMLPQGSFVLNRRAAGTQGYQDGGPVQGNSGRPAPPRDVIINVDLRGSHFSKNITLEEFKALMKELRRQGGKL